VLQKLFLESKREGNCQKRKDAEVISTSSIIICAQTLYEMDLAPLSKSVSLTSPDSHRSSQDSQHNSLSANKTNPEVNKNVINCYNKDKSF